MKDKIKRFFLITFGIITIFIVYDKVVYSGLYTNYTTQQIMNFVYNSGDNSLYVTLTGTNAVDVRGIDSVRLIQPPYITIGQNLDVDNINHSFSDTVKAVGVCDTIDFTAYYSVKFKCSFTATALVTLKWEGSTDSAQIPAGGSVSYDYQALSINSGNSAILYIWGTGTQSAYNGISQGQ